MHGSLGRIGHAAVEPGLPQNQVRAGKIRRGLVEGFGETQHPAVAGVGHKQVAIRIERQTDRQVQALGAGDRKSTRLNSSHTVISYAVFCLKKKKKQTEKKI